MKPRRVRRPLENPVRIIAITLKAQKDTISETLQNLRATFLESGVEADVVGRLEVALAETLNNIAEHGGHPRDEDAIRLTARISDGEVLLQIRDSGNPVPEQHVSSPALPDNSGPLQSLPEGGFGWFLIHKLADNVKYAHDGTENHLELVFLRK